MDKNAAAVAVFDKRAERYAALYMDVSQYSDSLNWYTDHLPNHAKVLELACGPGNVTRFLLDLNPNLQMLATDLAPKMVEIAKTHNPEANFKVMDCREISQFNNLFDGVVAAFCVPYLDSAETQKLITDIAGVLHANGLLYLSTIEDDELKSGWESSSSGDRVFMHYYQRANLKNWLADAGLSVVHEKQVETVDARGKSNHDLILIAQKITPDAF